MSIFDRFFSFNPFARFFSQVDDEERKKEEQSIKNSQGVSEVELQLVNSYNAQQQNYGVGVGGIVYTGGGNNIYK